MKKYLLALCCLLFCYLSFNQETTKEFNELLNKARSFNEAKDYQNAATVFSSAVRTGGNLVTINRRWSLACYWMRANSPDSAFEQLEIIASTPNLNLDFILKLIADDECFAILHKQKRWKDFIKIILNIQGRAVEAFVAAQGFVQSSNYDSAFYFLNIAAASKDLTFECAFFILTDGMFSNVSSDGKFKALESDKRWPVLKEKLFTNLYKKYFPASAFTNTKKSGKRMLIDGGHFNLHDIEGTYASLAGPLHSSGIVASGYKGKFDKSSLKNIDMLLISNPNPDRQDSIARRAQRANEPVRWSAAATLPGYTKDEVTAIHDWVNGGGSLFLILDHAPNGKVGEAIAAAFGIENRNVGTYDRLYRDPAVDTTQATTLLFTRSKNLIGKHPITVGLDSITTYTGESLIGPPGSQVLLYLPESAMDQDWLSETKEFRYRSAAGRTQAVAFDYGKGRVVMLGEAAITRPSSLSVSNRGNWKFILNILRWLAREKMD